MNRRPAIRPSAPTAPSGRRPGAPRQRLPAGRRVTEGPAADDLVAPLPEAEPELPATLDALLPRNTPVGPPPGRTPGTGGPARPAVRPGSRGRPPPARLPTTVSATSAQRFATRVRARRRTRWLLGAGSAVLAGGLAWTACAAPWLRVQQVQVTGLHRVPVALVQRAVAGERGRPLALLRSGAIADAVRADSRVRSVEVHRVWPDTVRVEVTERVAVAGVPGPGGVRLVDSDGREVAVEARTPPGLPLVQVDLLVAGAGALRSAVTVIVGLPADLRARVTTVGADSPDGVWLKLAGGVTVQWGDAGRNQLKADVLRRLLSHPAGSYDVSAPAAPAIGPPPETSRREH